MSDLPDPLVSSEVDLRGYEYMPYYGGRLRSSDLNSRATDAEYRAAHNLWWEAWNQVPAASLPDDDVTLCKLADLGRDLKAWAKVKPRALHGFVLCSDGRYYHRVLSAIALESWEGRLTASAKGKAGASKRWERHRQAKQMAQASEKHSTGIKENGTGNATAIENDSKRSKEKLSKEDLDLPLSGTGGGNGRQVKGLDILEVKTPDTPDVERNRRVAQAMAMGNRELAERIKAGSA